MFNLRCKLNCTMSTQIVRGMYYTDILPSIYEHLQHSYYQIGETINALRAGLSYILFVPHEDYMTENVEKYYRLPEIDGKEFKPRSVSSRIESSKVILTMFTLFRKLKISIIGICMR